MSIQSRLIVCALLVAVAGCDRGTQSGAEGTDASKAATPHRATGAGSVNLGRVLQVLGLAQQIEQRKQYLEQQVMAIQQEKQTAFDKKRKEYPEKLNEEQTKELQKVVVESQQIIQNGRAQAERQLNELNTYAMNVLKQKAAGPIAAIAERRGLAIVLLEPNAVVVYRAADADITEEVLEAIRASSPDGLNVAPPPAPTGGVGTSPSIPPATPLTTPAPVLPQATTGGAAAPTPAPTPKAPGAAENRPELPGK